MGMTTIELMVIEWARRCASIGSNLAAVSRTAWPDSKDGRGD